MLRIFSITGFLIAAWLIYKYVQALKATNESVPPGKFIQQNLALLKPSEFRKDFDKSLSVLIVICLVILALSGFLPVIIYGGAITGMGLIFHLIGAPFFAIALILKGIFHAENSTLTQVELQQLQPKSKSKNRSNDEKRTWCKISFWLLGVLGLIVILSITLTMYPIWGTPGQEILIGLHGYSALLFMVVFFIYSYLKLITGK